MFRMFQSPIATGKRKTADCLAFVRKKLPALQPF